MTALLSVCAAAGANDANGYAGSKACARCHERIYEDYLKKAMGRSVTPASAALHLAPSTPVTIENGGLTYEVTRSGQDLYEFESQKDADGKQVFRAGYRLEYAIGSGANGITWAIRRGNYLFESPLSWYARTGSWELSPGYENTATGFSRPIAAACIECHSGRARPVRDSEGLYLDPPFEEMSIGCENCHGPGEQHIAHPSNRTIINPARLSPQMADDICMNCHEAGDTRVYRPGRSNADFRPGEPLSHTVALLKIPPQPADGDRDLLEHNFSMLLSRCYRARNGRMSCLTCHDPHATPTKSDAAAYYERKCLTCHKEADCKLPAATRARKDGGCVACHMPKADIGFIAHSALTNHRIVVHATQPLPQEAYRLTTADVPDLVYMNRTNDEPLSPLMLLEAYGELSDRDQRYREPYLKTLRQFSLSDPVPLVQAALGMKAFKDGGAEATREAVAHLSKAIDGGYRSPAVFEALAVALEKQGSTADAIAILKRGVEALPWSARLQKLLALQYIETKQYDLARQTLVRYIDAFPEDRFVRDLLKKVGG